MSHQRILRYQLKEVRDNGMSVKWQFCNLWELVQGRWFLILRVCKIGSNIKGLQTICTKQVGHLLFVTTLSTHNSLKFSMLAYFILKYPLKCRLILWWISQQPLMIKPCFNFLNTLPVSGESLCIIRIYLYWRKLFYEFGWLMSPPAW